MSTREGIVAALTGVVTTGNFTVPPYPAVALRLRRALASERSGVSEIAEIAATDAALAATVLAAANSALLGSGTPIKTLRAAVNRLGARMVGAIALATGVGSVAVSNGALLDVKFRVWRRTMIGALICQELGPGRALSAEAAFLSGLLHGFGRSIAVASIEQLLRGRPAPLSLTVEEWLAIAEEQRAPFARAIANAWQLPSPIAEAISNEERGTSGLNDLVIEADAMASELEAGRTPSASALDEVRLLEELWRKLPASLAAFACEGGSTPRLASATTNAVAKPDHALTGELHDSTLTVVDRNAKGGSALTCMAVGEAGVEVRSSRRYQECAVVRLSIGDSGSVLEPWFTVVLCVPEGTRFRVELQLFSPTKEVREQWRALYAATERETTTSTHLKIATDSAAPQHARTSGTKSVNGNSR